MYKIGIFTRYSMKKDLYDGYHGSPYKIFKIMNELSNIIDCEYSVNDYNNQYDFAIVDRIKPAKNIKSKYILGIFETRVKHGWATDFCTISSAVKVASARQFHLPNYCHGTHLNPKLLNKKRSGGVYIGRLCSVAEFKIKLLNNSGLRLDIFPIKYWRGKKTLRFHDDSKESKENLSFLQSKFSNSKIRCPVNHKDLYRVINKKGYSYGFVPSIYGLGSKRVQVESSSKFFEYIFELIHTPKYVIKKKLTEESMLPTRIFDKYKFLIKEPTKTDMINPK